MSRSESILRKRIRKFRRLKRGYYAFLIVAVAYAVSFFLPLLANGKALVVKYEGEYFFPVASYYAASDFGLTTFGEADYRELDEQFEADGGDNWVLMPLDSVRAERRPARRFGLAAEPAVVGASRWAPTIAAATCSSASPTASTPR